MVEATTPPNPADGSKGTGAVRSVPDPTLLTIDALRREIAMLENLIDNRLIAADRLNAEKFLRVDALMEKAEEQRREQKADTKAAVDAALDSQKEATAKMERSISDQITSLRGNFETSLRGIQSSVADLKDRLTILESVKVGQSEQKTESRQSNAGLVAVLGLAVAVLLAIATVIGMVVGGGGA